MATGRHLAAADTDPPESDDDGSWASFRRLVIHEQRQCAADNKALRQQVAELHTQIAVLAVKVSIYATAAGAIASVIMSWLLAKH